MNIVADEGVDRPIVEKLRQAGHIVIYIAEEAPGISDEVVLSLAHQRSAILVTTDKDFGELIFRQQSVSGGVVLLRLEGLGAGPKAALVAEALKTYASEVSDSFCVIVPGSIRIRRRQQPA